jgi:hypothetical protein
MAFRVQVSDMPHQKTEIMGGNRILSTLLVASSNLLVEGEDGASQPVGWATTWKEWQPSLKLTDGLRPKAKANRDECGNYGSC